MADLNAGFMSAGSSFGMAQKPGETIETDKSISLLEPKSRLAASQENLEYQGLYAYCYGQYTRAKEARYFDETRWLTAYRNHRGIYGPDVVFTSTEKSRIFVKATTMKVNAAISQITEVCFADNRFPIGVQATPDPLGIAKYVHFDPKEDEASGAGAAQGAPGAPPSAPPAGSPQVSATIARPSILQALGSLEKVLEPIKDKLKDGASGSATAANWEPSKVAAELMQNKIQDQLEEAGASKSLRAFIFEFCLFGTGVFKGPILTKKEYPKWSPDGTYSPIFEDIADCTNVSLWDAYPDPEARKMEEAEYFVQRHRMSKTQLRALKKRPFFRPNSIDAAIEQGASYEEQYWEQTLKDQKADTPTERFEVLEYWGIADSDLEEIADIDIPAEYKDLDEVQINAWLCNGQILRLVFNPYTPARIPYYVAPYEVNPYSIFGVGVAENMSDMQLMMNGFARILVDNAVLSSNVIFEINETNLVPGQDFELYPGKQFKTQGQPGQSIFATKFPNVTQECILVFDKFRQLSDEVTGIPSYSHGVSGVMSTGRTAAGMSMLMGAADKGTKSVVRNLDDYLFTPLGKGFYAFNMQFNFDKNFIGDLDIVALGTESLMRNEIYLQNIREFLQMTANPIDAPWVKRDFFLREAARGMKIDPDLGINDSRTAMIQAEMLKNLSIAQGIPPGTQQGQQGTPPAPGPTQQGGPPAPAATPGGPGFSGGGGGQNSPPPAQPPQGGPQ